jgi:predicted O-methyltransferase YrrM
MNTDIQAYIQQLVQYPHPHLEVIERESAGRADIEPNIGLQIASLLDLLVRIMQVKNALEFGTCLGFSTVVLANALQQTGGRLTAVESNPRMAAETRRNLERAGLSAVVNLVEADAARFIHSVNGPYDLILQDAFKPLYPQMLDRSIELLRVGGILAADDTLFPAMPIPERYKPVIDEYNRRVFNHPDLVSTILPIGDGLTLSLKIR